MRWGCIGTAKSQETARSKKTFTSTLLFEAWGRGEGGGEKCPQKGYFLQIPLNNMSKNYIDFFLHFFITFAS